MTRRALAAALLAGLAALPASAQTEPPADDLGFYLMLMWHQHQPLYPKALHPEDGSGVYSRPWVRVHATKDYHDMAALVAEHPGVRAVFNLTPALLLQLEDLAAGAKDRYWVTTEIPAARLTADDRRFLLERFFDVNPKGDRPLPALPGAGRRPRRPRHRWGSGRVVGAGLPRSTGAVSISPGPIRTSWPPRRWRSWWNAEAATSRRTRRWCWPSTGTSSGR